MNLEDIDYSVNELEKEINKTEKTLKEQKELYEKCINKLSNIVSKELANIGTGKARKNGINPYLYYRVIREPESVTIPSLKKVKNILLNIK